MHLWRRRGGILFSVEGLAGLVGSREGRGGGGGLDAEGCFFEVAFCLIFEIRVCGKNVMRGLVTTLCLSNPRCICY